MNMLQALLADPSFVSNAVLLILGAVLTGFLVPIVKSRLDDASAARKQLLEAELSRQSEFLRAQTDLLASFSDETWAFLFTAFKVSYAEAWEDTETQEQAWEVYTPMSWTHLGRIRAIISKSKRLIGDGCYVSLLETYEWLLRSDDDLAAFHQEGHSPKEWQDFHFKRFTEAALVMDGAIEGLANELKLSAGPAVRPPPGSSAAPVGRQLHSISPMHWAARSWA